MPYKKRRFYVSLSNGQSSYIPDTTPLGILLNWILVKGSTRGYSADSTCPGRSNPWNVLTLAII